jgi:alpha-beta hydrolase superfamily lysophospholipase
MSAEAVDSMVTSLGGPTAAVPAPAGAEDAPPPPGRPIVFGPPERALVGFYHPPQTAPALALTVVLCNPLGFEAMSAHRAYRHLAERLAARGFPALRFDYEGTGDSAGRLDEPGRVRAWIESIKAAVSEARARSGSNAIALFGVRLGATLAMAAASELADVQALILWAPVVTGRVHVRELHAFRLLKKVRAGNRAAPARSDGGAEVGGFVFGRETLDDLSGIDLLAMVGGADGKALWKRALILSRGERPAADETRLTEGMRARGVEVGLLPESGYAKMIRDDPYETVVPAAGLDAIVDWLHREPYPGRRGGDAAGGGPAAFPVVSGEGKSPLHETPLLFGPEKRLMGVLTEPPEPLDRRHPVFIFLNVGANHHVGPHRMNVALSRELASLGYPAFRMDAAGLGDSPAAPNSRENRIYTKDAIADVRSAMVLLREMRRMDRFVLVGVCSGAYLAYHTAIEDTRVVGQVLLSPFAFEWKEGDSVAVKPRKTYRSTRAYARALLDRQVWLRMLKGDVEARGIAGVVLERVRTEIQGALASARARLEGKQSENTVLRAFRAMSTRGVETLVILSFDDSGVDMIQTYLGADARKMRGRRHFEMEIIEGLDHAFQSLESQQVLRDKLTRYAKTRFA